MSSHGSSLVSIFNELIILNEMVDLPFEIVCHLGYIEENHLKMGDRQRHLHLLKRLQLTGSVLLISNSSRETSI